MELITIGGRAMRKADAVDLPVASLFAEIERLRGDRDELLAALKNARNILKDGGYVYAAAVDTIINKVSAPPG